MSAIILFTMSRKLECSFGFIALLIVWRNFLFIVSLCNMKLLFLVSNKQKHEWHKTSDCNYSSQFDMPQYFNCKRFWVSQLYLQNNKFVLFSNLTWHLSGNKNTYWLCRFILTFIFSIESFLFKGIQVK